jgi:hypothetical protein
MGGLDQGSPKVDDMFQHIPNQDPIKGLVPRAGQKILDPKIHFRPGAFLGRGNHLLIQIDPDGPAQAESPSDLGDDSAMAASRVQQGGAVQIFSVSEQSGQNDFRGQPSFIFEIIGNHDPL